MISIVCFDPFGSIRVLSWSGPIPWPIHCSWSIRLVSIQVSLALILHPSLQLHLHSVFNLILPCLSKLTNRWLTDAIVCKRLNIDWLNRPIWKRRILNSLFLYSLFIVFFLVLTDWLDFICFFKLLMIHRWNRSVVYWLGVGWMQFL